MRSEPKCRALVVVAISIHIFVVLTFSLAPALSEIRLKTPSASSLLPLPDHSPLVLTRSHGTVSWAILLYMGISTFRKPMRSTLLDPREISVASRAMQCPTISKHQMRTTQFISQSFHRITFHPTESSSYMILRYVGGDGDAIFLLRLCE